MPVRSSSSPSPSQRPFAALLVFAVAYAGGVIGYLPLLTLFLPVRVQELAGESRLGLLTAVVIIGALTASVSNVLFGWLSDRSVTRGGSRRAWMVLGLGTLLVAYAGIAAAPSVVPLIGAIMLFQIGVNAVLAPLMALMAEEVPDDRKGMLGGLLAFANPIASGLSAFLVTAEGLSWTTGLLLIPVAAAACVAPLLVGRSAPPVQASADPALPPRRDLAIAWGGRLLAQVAGNVLFLYLPYYFESIAPDLAPTAIAGRVGHLLTLSYLLPLPVALVAGRVFDTSGRRKAILLASAAFAALGLIGMAAAHQWREGAIGFGVYAIGSAVFLALHAGFSMQLLPSPRHRGRDLGLINLSNTLPALAGPLLTWWLASPSDFALLMLVLAALTLAGGLLLLAARGAQRDQ